MANLKEIGLKILTLCTKWSGLHKVKPLNKQKFANKNLKKNDSYTYETAE